MARNPGRWALEAVVATAFGLALVPLAEAIPLDKDGTINVNLRAYVNMRVSTKATQSTRPGDQPESCATDKTTCNFGGTYPFVGAGNVIQNRYFLETKWRHDLVPLLEDWLPEDLTTLEYLLWYRGEYDGIYDFGPKAFSENGESRQEIEQILRQAPTFAGDVPATAQTILSQKRHRLREVASYRNRLFQVYADLEWGPVFFRIGRQNLAWGETDVFRLLDNINPVDNSFGGFFIDLDERRVPLNMIRGSYFLGTLGPLDQTFLEGYFAVDNTLAFIPGAPAGSPWSTPLGPPSGANPGNLIGYPGIFESGAEDSFRGGGRLVTNVSDFTFTLASYVTFLDIQAVRFVKPCGPDDNSPGCGPDAGVTPNFIPGSTAFEAQQYAPHVWVNGASMTTAIPQLKSVLRSELAWFRDEAFFRGPTADGFPGKGLTPEFLTDFLLPAQNQSRNGGVINPDAPSFDTVYRADSLNFAIGWDMNQYIRFLNPTQTFFFSTQFFWKHIFDFDPLTSYPVPLPNNPQRVVSRVEDEFLQTLLINTTYNTAIPGTDFNVQTTPGMSMFYDWQGMILFQPSLRFVRDPWRLIVDYTTIDSGVFRGQIGLVRDRSNVRVQVEYVL
jgi:hypothetical protein